MLLSLALSNAVAATLLAALVVMVTWIIRRPAVRHALWLLVLLKLLMPPLIPLPLLPPRSIDTPPIIGESPAPLPSPTAITESVESIALTPAPDEEDASPQPEPEPAAPAATASWQSMLAALWLCGSFAWWSIALVRLRRFHRLLHQARSAPECVQEQARRLAARMRLRRCPPISFLSAPLSPMLWALGFSPRLLLPAELWARLSAEQQDTLLAHELAHLRRGDAWVRRLEFIVLGLYWWHPVAWWARRRLQEVEEECCDAHVLAVLPDAAPAYAAALVETVAFLSQTRIAAPLGASGAGQVPLLKRRLTMILTANPSRRSSWAVYWIGLGLGALLLLTPGAAQTDPPSEPKRVESGDGVANKPPQPKRDAKWKPMDALAVQGGSLNRARQWCANCHVAKPPAAQLLEIENQPWSHAHDTVIRLMDEIQEKKAQLREAEAKLQRALDKLSGSSDKRNSWVDPRTHTRYWVTVQPPAKDAKPRQPDRGQAQQDRLKELERKLDALRQEIQDMRRQSRPELPKGR